jgi:hypothetical protein
MAEPRISDDKALRMIACSPLIHPPSAGDDLTAVCLDLLEVRRALRVSEERLGAAQRIAAAALNYVRAKPDEQEDFEDDSC